MAKLLILISIAVLVAWPISGLINWWIWKDYKVSCKEALKRLNELTNH